MDPLFALPLFTPPPTPRHPTKPLQRAQEILVWVVYCRFPNVELPSLLPVLGLMDLPPPAGQASATSSSGECLGSLVSLKIAMGKAEYQTGDKGDFSFPVTSLRENLKLTLLDADGNEIAQTDVKTMVVVEKRFWDALFPLEGGGCVHLKLQFILNDEEHKRIREMREAVLKRRHGDLPKSNFKDPLAENIIGSSANVITEEGRLADQLPVKSQDRRGNGLLASLSQDLPQQLEHHYEQDAIPQSNANEEASGYEVNQNDIDEMKVSLEETTDAQSRGIGPLVTEETTATSSSVSEETMTTSSSPSAITQEERRVSTGKESEHEKFPVSNTKKLISAFESISVQEPIIRVGPTAESWMRRVKRGGSSGAPWPEEMNTEKAVIQKMMPKSFSTGALPQMKSASFGLPYVKGQEEEKHTDFSIRKKNLGNNNQSIESKNDQNFEKLDPGNKKAVGKFLSAAEPPSHERISETSEVIETKEVITFCSSADISKNVDQYPSHEAKEGPLVTFQLRRREHGAFEEKIEEGSFPKGVSFLHLETSHGKLDVTASSCCEKEWNMLPKINKGNNKMAEGPSVSGKYNGGLESFDGRELVDASKIRKDEEASTKDYVISRKAVAAEHHSCSSMHQGQQKTSVAKPESGIICTRNDVNEFIACGSVDVKLDMLTYFHAEQCLLGSHANSVPRHLCITSGSKQLKDIIGGFISI